MEERQVCEADIEHWVGKNFNGSDVIVFDTETNGLNPENTSVLSIAGIRLAWSKDSNVLKEVARMERFYFPVEGFNLEAVSVNGLTPEVLEKVRENCTYPKYFKEDNAFEKFCAGAKYIAGHNVSFDVKFVPSTKYMKRFCTMYATKDIVKSAQWDNGDYKFPKLKESAKFYDIPVEESSLHGAMYDVEITTKLLTKILQDAKFEYGEYI